MLWRRNSMGGFGFCPNGGKDCHYRHALPPGYVLKSQMKALLEEESEKVTIEDEIEDQRKKVQTTTPMTTELFMEWKRKKAEEREAGLAALRAERAKNDRMSGRELFMADSSVFVDDAEAYEAYERHEEESEANEEQGKKNQDEAQSSSTYNGKEAKEQPDDEDIDDDDDLDIDELNELEASLSRTSIQIREPGITATGDLHFLSIEQVEPPTDQVIPNDNDTHDVGLNPFVANMEGQETSSTHVEADEMERAASASPGQKGDDNGKKRKQSHIAGVLESYLEFKEQSKKFVEELNETTRPVQNDEFSIGKCVATLESIEELTDMEKAKSLRLFKCELNREIFINTRNPSVRLLWLKNEISLQTTLSHPGLQQNRISVATSLRCRRPKRLVGGAVASVGKAAPANPT